MLETSPDADMGMPPLGAPVPVTLTCWVDDDCRSRRKMSYDRTAVSPGTILAAPDQNITNRPSSDTSRFSMSP